MKPSRSFASDNNAGVHLQVLQAVAEVNRGHAIGYGDDPYTASVVQKFKQHFGADIEVFFVFNGTAANCLSLKALTNSYHAVICGERPHLYRRVRGPGKIHRLQAHSGTRNQWQTYDRICHSGLPRHRRPASCAAPRHFQITQATEVGTVYQAAEIKALARFAHDRGMFLHMDGARIANAAASLGQNLRQATRDLGVDVFLSGGPKTVRWEPRPWFFSIRTGHDFLYLRKQGMQLASKMRFISAQFDALFTGDLWLRSAQHANRMARLLEKQLREIPQVKIVYKVEANGVFAKIRRSAIARLKKRYFFYVWNEQQSIVRWMCSFDTTEQDVKEFARFVAQTVKGR